MLFVNVLICSAIVFISYFFWNCCQKVFFIRRLDGIPGPKTLPLIGNFYHLLKKGLYEDFINVILRLLKNYPSLCQLWVGSKLFIVISKADEAKTVLYSKNCMDKGTIYRFVSPLFGMGLLTAPESIWTRIRKMTAPTFNSHMMQNFFNTFAKQSVILTDELETVGLNGNEIIHVHYIENCTWKIACDSLMGVLLEPNKNVQAVNALQKYVIFFF
ncbi:PREDICTED: cytochrome P450 4C1-like [Wasmannia auropunctata]|uniref:cytochrome P450 4C1-like n=1 Tax=Wasmannia auropunctata TaxID=64793 RepID=UPI0005F014B4|nr:PREDICTED: cytochrome P450 4C1-like [Wasmannia auropunctata]